MSARSAASSSPPSSNFRVEARPEFGGGRLAHEIALDAARSHFVRPLSPTMACSSGEPYALRKKASVMPSRIAPQLSRQVVIHDEAAFSMASSGLSGLTGVRLARTASVSGFTAFVNGF